MADNIPLGAIKTVFGWFFKKHLGRLSLVALLGGGGIVTDTLGVKSTLQHKIPALGEILGAEKRDVLIDRIEDAQKSQEEVKEQFQTALEAFKDLTGFDGGELEKKYVQLKSEYERSADVVKNVGSRIDKITSASNRMLDEWRDELKEYSNQDTRRSSAEKFDSTRQRLDELIAKMRTAESRADTVLGALNDQVLFLKHNLNSQAIADLKDEAAKVENDVEGLIRDMEESIQAAKEFVTAFEANT